MVTSNMPAAEVEIDEALVRALLIDQHLDLAGLAITSLGSGWNNAIFRLGEQYTIRLPRRALAAVLIEQEQRWLPSLAPELPLPVSAPLRTGRAALGYPWTWSIGPWFPGAMAAVCPPPDSELAAAVTMAEFLRALHRPAPWDAPANPYRGVPLAERDVVTRDRIRHLGDTIDGPRVLAVWESAVAAPRWSGPPLWLHGDLHPANVLVNNGRISAVIDFGDMTAGDPATDLAVAWMMFSPTARLVFRAASAPIEAATWTRARGSALAHSLACLANSADNRTIADMGDRTLRAVLSDPTLR